MEHFCCRVIFSLSGAIINTKWPFLGCIFILCKKFFFKTQINRDENFTVFLALAVVVSGRRLRIWNR
jgi:hypothetical protein